MLVDKELDEFKNWLKDNGKYNLSTLQEVAEQFDVYMQEKSSKTEKIKFLDTESLEELSKYNI